MKTRLFFIAAILFSCQLFAQRMNEYGHFVRTDADSNEFKINLANKGSEIQVGDIKLQGSSAFRTASGFVTLSGMDDNSSSTVRIYDLEGKKYFDKVFSHTVNFVLSPSKNFCAFSDTKEIHIINLSSGKRKTFEGSNVFGVNDDGKPAYYNDVSSEINFRNQKIKISEPVYKILFFKNQPLFITKKSILVLKNKIPEIIFSATEGRVFDAGLFDGKLFISVKKEVDGKFIFSSFCSEDLQLFTPLEESRLTLAHKINKLKPQNKAASRTGTRSLELIRDPIFYYNDTVYQPIGNSYCEMQEYTIGDPYPHQGVDLLGTVMQDVYSVKDGFVKAILTISGSAHWRIAISNNNTPDTSAGYLYAHVDEFTIPYAVGDSVTEGDMVGRLFDFPVVGFVHCHFARITDQGLIWSGNWWTFENPLASMTNLFDTIPPQFETVMGDTFAFRDVNGNYQAPWQLSGSVRVISKVHDIINSSWHVDVNKIRYSLSPFSSWETMLLDTFAYEYNFYNDAYFSNTYSDGLLNTIYSRDVDCYTTADYNVRDFYHLVTSSDGNDTIDGNDSLQLFNTINFPDGDYIFRVIASDPSGNTSVDSMIIGIRNFTSTHDIGSDSRLNIFPNPFTSQISVSIQKEKSSKTEFIVRNNLGQIVFKEQDNCAATSLSKIIDLNFLSRGIYLLEVIVNGERTIRKIIKD